MHKKSVILTAVIFFLIVAGMFIYALLKSSELQNDTADFDEQSLDVKYDDITRIDTVHFFIDGVHTFVGEFLLPTPCDLLHHEVTIKESYPEIVDINFSVINNADTCVQVVTAARFMITVNASEAASFTANFQGEPIILNIIEAPEGSIPDTFELYLK